MTEGYDLICVLGPTASGKTRYAVQLARELGGEILSGDSRQVYRGMDIGTGKDLAEYEGVPYHLIDIRPAGYRYSLYEFLEDCERAIDDIRGRGKPVIMCGGTGMYVETVVKGIKLPPVPRNEELRAELAGKSLEELTALLKTMKTLRNNSDIDTVAVGAVLLANDDVSEDDVYKIISGIYENMDAITKAHSKGAELNLITASSVKSVPYHKGAAKYYSEKGITVPTK